MAVTLALAGDTMLGRRVAERLAPDPDGSLVAVELEEIARAADLLILNLECRASERRERVGDADRRFFFRSAGSRRAAYGDGRELRDAGSICPGWIGRPPRFPDQQGRRSEGPRPGVCGYFHSDEG
jgi:hypothetical protein